jgi:hypothetical protein
MDIVFGLMIFLFSVLIMFAGAFSVYGLIRGNTALWPAVVGLGFATALMIGTFVGIAIKWGDCGSTSETSAGAVTCVVGDCASGCNPDVWKVDCRTQSACPAPTPVPRANCVAPPLPAPVTTPTPLATNSYCPRGQKAVYDYCEKIQPNSGVRQPWATWSDLSFVAAGLWILWLFKFFDRVSDSTRAGTWLVPITADNPMVQIGSLSVIYGLIVIFMGPPSMWFHASMREWAGWFDSMSVVIWLFFNAVYVWYSICGAMWGRGRAWAWTRPLTIICIWASGVVMFGIIGWMFPDKRLIFYFISGGLWGLGEAIYLLISGVALGIQYKRNGWIFFVNFLLLAATMTIWIFWNPGIVPASWCISNEAFPGHALFHILASISTVVTYFSFASEAPPETSPSS